MSHSSCALWSSGQDTCNKELVSELVYNCRLWSRNVCYWKLVCGWKVATVTGAACITEPIWHTRIHDGRMNVPINKFETGMGDSVVSMLVRRPASGVTSGLRQNQGARVPRERAQARA